MSVRRGVISKAVVYKKERYYFSIVCTFKKAIKYSEVKVDVQEWALSFRKKNDRCVSFVQLTISFIVVIW